MAGACTGPGPCDTKPLGAGKNWVNKVGGLPAYIRAIAHSLVRSGHSESEAIQLAIGTVKNWASGQGKVTPATRTRAAAAVAEWERKKAQAHVSLSTPMVATTDGAMLTIPGHMRAIRKLAVAHKTAGPSQRPKLKAAMASHAKAIQKMRGK